MSKIKINLAKSAGFCFGVKRALEIAFKAANSGAKVYMLGDIVHNEAVIRQLEKIGIKKLKHLGQGKDKTLLIRAHGARIKVFQQALKKGYRIIDATCPMVKEIHSIAKNMEEKGFPVIVIGDTKHDEVQGIIGQLKKRALIIDEIKNIPLKTLKKQRQACVVVQSTQNLEKVLKIINLLKQYIPILRFFNTICQPTRTKQAEIKMLSKQNEVMLIIGSKDSANTRRLYEISRAINKRSYWVNSAKDIKRVWFKHARKVGITAGASTPQESIQDIVTYLSLIRSSPVKIPSGLYGVKGAR